MREDLAAALRAWLDTQRPAPTKTATIETALELFLESKGFWPRPGEQPAE